jgi:UDP-N-acetylglucosamine--N-acetylmuramyl-(pentapeptide) pyrophosphoryl-undecaprenol N-acetylglucosamine transferase
VTDLRVPHPPGGAPRPWFVFAGGGTGGHLFPALSVVEWLRTGDAVDVSFFCTQRPIDRDILGAAGVEALPLSVRPLPSRPWRWPAFLWHWRRSVGRCMAAFRHRRPGVVVGAGGYASGPPVHAALKLKIPTFLLNPDAVPGQANKHLARRKALSGIFAQWPITLKHFPSGAPVAVCGCPVRAAFLECRPDARPFSPVADRYNAESPGEALVPHRFVRPEMQVGLPDQRTARESFGLRPDVHMLLVTGASQGARTVNEAMMRLGGAVAKAGWQVLHLSGAADRERVEQAYSQADGSQRSPAAAPQTRADMSAQPRGPAPPRPGATGPHVVLPFVDRMAEAMVASDLILSRAGASSLAEILAVGRPCILLPYPFHRDRHQWHNGQVLVDAGAAVMLEDRRDATATAAELEPILTELMTDHARRERMAQAARALGRPGAARQIAVMLAEAATAPPGSSCWLSRGEDLQLKMLGPSVRV